MGCLDAKKDHYLDLCADFIRKQFGNLDLQRHAGGVYMTAPAVAPAGGGEVRCFDASHREWMVMEDPEVAINMVHDGKVFVSYPMQDPEDSGMYFKMVHPREVAELLQLFVQPGPCFPDGETKHEARTLGEVASVHVLIPDGKVWRVLDPAALPAGTDDEFRKLVHTNLVRDWDGFTMGDAVQAFRYAERWPSIVGSLPDANELLKQGYLLEWTGHVRSAVDLAIAGPAGDEFFFDLLVVPTHQEVSAWCLREYLSSDADIGKEIKKAFKGTLDLDATFAALKKSRLYLPATLHEQIRIAAEHDSIRQWLLYVSETLAAQRETFYLRADNQWHLAHTLSRMVK